MLAYFFPPQGGSGVQRSLKYARYLPEFGWQPRVITVQPPSNSLLDDSLNAEIPPGLSIAHTTALLLPAQLPWRLRHFIARWLLVTDEQLGWLPFALRRARQTLQEQQIAAIYTTAAPYTTHLAGLRLKRLSGLPWIADWRDPWIGNFSATFATSWHRWLATKLERAIIHEADVSMVVSEPMRRALLARYPDLAPERVMTLPNGFDPADFEDVAPLGREPDRLVIVYSGSFYGQRQSPRPFLEALDAVLTTDPVIRPAIKVRFVGNTGAAAQVAHDLSLEDVVEFTGYVPHRKSIGYLLGADLLLLVIGSGSGSDAVFTGKIFEYLAASKPILCLADPGVSAHLVAEANAGMVVGAADVPAIARALGQLYQDWKAGVVRYPGNPGVTARYDRRRQTQRLAALLDGLVATSQP